MTSTLTDNMVGKIAYTMKVDGEIVDEIAPEDAIEYLHGAENIVPGLEKALTGKTVGDTISVTIQPEDGYGERDEEDVDVLSRSQFDEAEALEVGMEVELMDEDGDLYEAVIAKIDGDDITLDFNHPFAGKVLYYDATVVDVREATEDEREAGVPQSLMEDIFDALLSEDIEFEVIDDHPFSEN